MNDVWLTFYGDDFTGSTDALEALANAGLSTVLFTRPPTKEMLARYPNAQAVGLAGVSRSLGPEEIESELSPAFAALSALKPRHLHYKVCSTFDSSPEIGSIGKAIEIGRRYSGANCVPLLVGNPDLGRYCIFGNLFAQEGVGHQGAVYRLDRHPTASAHPVTPMQESDLRLHLARQADLSIGLFDVLDLALPKQERRDRFKQLLASKIDVVLLDVLLAAQLADLGELVDIHTSGEKPLFSVGSSGVESALCAHWQATGKLAENRVWGEPSAVDQLLVISGSRSPVTAAQIDWAISQGFAELALDSCVLTDEECNSYLLKVAAKLVNLIVDGKSVVLHTGRGSMIPPIGEAADRFAGWNTSSLAYCSFVGKSRQSRLIGSALGRIVSLAIEQTGIKRVCLAGGDTASYATREMGIESLEMISPTTRGVPLCRAHAPGQPVDGVEICFKGGQVGMPTFFGSLLRLGINKSK